MRHKNMMGQPIYKHIYDDLLEKISSGAFNAGDRLPSEKELCDTYNVSRITSKRALEILAAQGYILRSPGKGSYVNTQHGQESKSHVSPLSVGLIIPDFSDSFGTKLLYGIEERCSALGYHLIVKRTRDQTEDEEKAIKALSGTAGILIQPIHGEFYNSEILKLILNNRALVFVDRRLKGLAVPSITTNNVEAAEEGTRYLLEQGHRNIAFFSGPLIHTSTVEDRYQGFMKAHSKSMISHNPAYLCQGLSSIWTWPFYSPGRVVEDVKIASELLKTHPEISAAFTVEYAMAYIVKAAVESLGQRIPEDFSILTFDAPPTITGIPPISHLCQNEYVMGQEAVEALHRVITGGDPAAAGLQIPAKLIIGSSTGPKRSAEK